MLKRLKLCRMHAAGLSKRRLRMEGISCQQAFDGLTAFVNNKTQPGQTPAIVAHDGFALHFPIMEAALLRSARAAGGPRPDATADSSSNGNCSGSSSSSLRRRRQNKRTAQALASQLSIADSSAVSAAAGYTGWPAAWLFHDTLLLARCLQGMQPSSSHLCDRLANTKQGECMHSLRSDS